VREPSPEQLAPLTRLERFAFKLADRFTDYPEFVAKTNDTFMALMIWSCGGKRIRVSGLEHLARFTNEDSILFVANHRSFFDFYVLSAVLYWHTTLPRRMFFPVRSTFFYDHPLGPLVNAAMSGMRMFPPILREKEKGAFNIYAVARAVEELEVPGTIMGFHPEGTRNKGDDPYSMLPAQSGVGKVAIDAKRAHVVPAFIYGLSNELPEEWRRNWTAHDSHTIDVVFGPEVPLEDLRSSKARAASLKKAAARCHEAIGALAEQHRSGAYQGPVRPLEHIFARPSGA
jgi:1-acyl-sn-glycerol-3-phosphate acyltransferase